VTAYFNRKYVSFRIDMEKGEAPDLAKKFHSVNVFPALLFFGSDVRLTSFYVWHIFARNGTNNDFEV
jgi:hypothetical protein